MLGRKGNCGQEGVETLRVTRLIGENCKREMPEFTEP
jgi:hypothetical protein